MVDVKLTEHLADLSKINFTEQELTHVAAQMLDIIALMDKIGNWNVNNNNISDDGRRFPELRQDVSLDSFPREEILDNAQGKRGGFFSVTKVFE